MRGLVSQPVFEVEHLIHRGDIREFGVWRQQGTGHAGQGLPLFPCDFRVSSRQWLGVGAGMSDDTATFLVVAGLAVLLLYLLARGAQALKVTTVHDFQAGLLYGNGRFQRLLGPGRYRQWLPGREIVVQDLRLQELIVGGQEILTADNLTAKASAVVQYRINDARKAHESTTNTYALFYSDVQVALRRAVAQRTLEQVLAERGEIGAAMRVDIMASAERLGLSVERIELRDLMLSGETKRAYADIFRAQKEGEAQLARARAETAALRNLANGARLLKDNPALFNLRLLQTLGTASAKGATVVINTAETVPATSLAPAAETSEPITE
jgi:regulator of protease activity HflC (stomatin/prohibitin superfamily)